VGSEPATEARLLARLAAEPACRSGVGNRLVAGHGARPATIQG
jgi:hypothetical protein